MKIYTASEKHPGDIVWAFEYSGEQNTRGMKLRQEPVQGMLLCRMYPDNANAHIDKSKPVRYFVPFGKSGKPCWSKVVMGTSRSYADNEADAWKGYNLAIKRLIAEHQAAIQELNSALVDDKNANKEKNEDGHMKITASYRADMSICDEEIFQAIKGDLRLLDDQDVAKIMSWDEFQAAVKSGCLTDYDGNGDLLIDGYASSDNLLWITTDMLYIYDKYMIPFDRIPEVFRGHKIQVAWFNK